MDIRRKTILLVFGLAGALLPQRSYSKSRYPSADISMVWSDQRVFPDDGREYVPPPPRTRTKHVVHNEAKVENDVRNNRKVCETQECKIIAKEFLSSINKTIDPCEDFYEFTCGGWSSKDVIPPSSAIWSRFMIFQNTVLHRIKGALEVPAESSDILPVRQAKKWYQSCMNIENLEKRGITPIESIMMQAGGWPITMEEQEWDPEEYTWQKIEQHYFRLTGSHVFNKIRVGGMHPEKKLPVIMIEITPKPLTEEAPLKSRDYSGKHYDAYVKLVERVAESVVKHNKANVSEKKLRKEAEEIVDFEKQLFELETNSSGGGIVDFGDLALLNDIIMDHSTDPKAKIDLAAMIKRSFDSVKIEVDPKTDIIIDNAAYLTELAKLFGKTPARTIANYVHWTFVSSVMMYTTEQMRDELLSFFSEEFGIKERRPRWSECVSDMKMAHAAAYVFVYKYFNKTTWNAAIEMIKHIQHGMQEKIEKSNWLDAESKIIATEKLNRMKIFLGFPSWYNNDTAFLNHYKGMTISTGYFDNILSHRRFEQKKKLQRYSWMAEPEERWEMDPITVNALYGPLQNMLNLPAVDFQAPLLTPQLPNAVNYAVVGVIIGHEMGHGFDDIGIQYSKDGNETELSELILKSYYQQADCFTDQYEKYYRRARGLPEDTTSTDPNRHHQKSNERSPQDMATNSRSENIADTTGLQVVFQAYNKLNKENGVSTTLPGLEEYTDEQLFFLSFASVWCKVATPQFEEKEKAKVDPHSPAKMRVIGSISNTIDFARVFNCPKGSPMNPNNKCSIWDKSEPTLEVKTTSIEREHFPWGTQRKP